MHRSPNTITSAETALINGRMTGLAGCRNNDTCPLASECLRADARLLRRAPMNPDLTRPCEVRVPTDGIRRTRLLYSTNESATMDGQGYYSLELGWTYLENATRFSEAEAKRFEQSRLPQSLGQDRHWIDDPVADLGTDQD